MPNQSTVYVLDDDHAILDAISMLMSVAGRPVKVYERVDDFLSGMDVEDLGCLLLDLRLPGDGMTVLKYFQENQIKVPTIVMTGHGDADVKARAFKLGAFEFVEKPFNARQLVKLVDDAMAPTRSAEPQTAQTQIAE